MSSAVEALAGREAGAEGRLRTAYGTDSLGWGFLVLSLVVWTVGVVAGAELAVLALVMVGLAGAVYGLVHPAVGLLSVGILCTLDAPSRYVLMNQGGLFRWNTLNYLLAFIAVLNAPFLLRLRNRQCILWQLFLLLLAVQLFHSPELKLGILRVLALISPAGLIVYFSRNVENQRLWYWVGMVNGATGALGGFVFFLNGGVWIAISVNEWVRFPLTAIFSICLAFHYASISRRGQITLALLAATNFGWVFLAGSRGAVLIACLCGVFLLTRVRGVSRRLLVFGAAGMLAGAIIVVFPGLIGRTADRFLLLFDSTSSARARTSGRSDLMLGAWYMFRENPLGVGTGGFEAAWANLDLQGGLSGFKAGKSMAAHSGWTKTLAENGFPGVLLFAAFIGSFLVTGLRRKEEGLWAYSLLVAALLSMAAVTTEFDGKGLWFLVIGVMVLLNRGDVLSAVRRTFFPSSTSIATTGREGEP